MIQVDIVKTFEYKVYMIFEMFWTLDKYVAILLTGDDYESSLTTSVSEKIIVFDKNRLIAFSL